MSAAGAIARKILRERYGVEVLACVQQVQRIVADIDPEKHRLVIHGLVKQPLVFTLDTLGRYPTVSRMAFVECGGNSAPLFSNEPIQASVQALHGLVSCAEWTGVPLSTLLDEAGIDSKAKWIIAEGGDAPVFVENGEAVAAIGWLRSFRLRSKSTVV